MCRQFNSAPNHHLDRDKAIYWLFLLPKIVLRDMDRLYLFLNSKFTCRKFYDIITLIKIFMSEVQTLKKALLIFVTFLVLFLNSCDENKYSKMDYYFGDYRVYYQSHGTCEMLVQEIIFEDGDTTYTLESSGCDITSYYFIMVSGDFIDIPSAIVDEIITIDQVIDSDFPHLIITAPTAEPT